MTLITRLGASALTCALVAAGAGVASAKPPIDPLSQHVHVTTRTTTGQNRNPTLFGRWRYDKPLPSIVVRGSNDPARTSTFTADSPVPGLSRTHAHGYCVTQHYAAATQDPATATLTYSTTVVVRRHHRVVARHTSRGTYTGTMVATGTHAGPTRVRRDHVRLRGFHFGPHDKVTWTIRGKLTNEVRKFRTKAIIGPRCS